MIHPMTAADKIDFIGIGATRSGTTWLSECLRQHPDILLPRPDRQGSKTGELAHLNLKEAKELDYFIIDYPGENGVKPRANHHKGLEWYLSQFPPAAAGKIRGEFSPAYILDEDCAGRIKQTFPDVKLIAVLRDPPDMIYSLYWFRAYGVMREDLSFEEAIGRGHYLQRGLYHQQLKKFYDIFPKERIHVALHDDIRTDPAKMVRDVYEFLGVRSDFAPSSLRQKINETKKTRSDLLKNSTKNALSLFRKCGLGALTGLITSNQTLYRLYCRLNLGKGEYPPMRADTRRKLRKYYREDILELQKMIGRDLSAWL